MDVICPYCGNPAELVDGLVIYPHRPDLAHKRFYRCAPCDAYVGCHPGTVNPLGRLADVSLAAFDPLWKSGAKRRNRAYTWLADQLKISRKACHIGMFDVETCRRVVDICRKA